MFPWCVIHRHRRICFCVLNRSYLDNVRGYTTLQSPYISLELISLMRLRYSFAVAADDFPTMFAEYPAYFSLFIIKHLTTFSKMNPISWGSLGVIRVLGAIDVS